MKSEVRSQKSEARIKNWSEATGGLKLSREKREVLVLGVDPGIAITGYGLLKSRRDGLEVIDYGCIKTTKQSLLSARLKEIYLRLTKIIQDCQPEVVAVEELFFSKNVRTALTIGEARGVIILAVADAKLPLFEYTPLQVKQAVTGYGKATKLQVKYMVKSLLGLGSLPKPDDVSDALAIAICHLHSYKVRQKTEDRNLTSDF